MGNSRLTVASYRESYEFHVKSTITCGGKRAARLPRSMKVKVVQLSEPHVMRVLSFPTPERAPKTTSNDVKARGLRDKYGPSYVA